MPAKKLIFSLAIAAMVTLPATMARAGDLDIQTSTVQMSLGEDGGVFIRTIPMPQMPQVRIYNPNRQIRNVRPARQLKCRNVSQRRNSARGNSQVFTSTTTTICN